MSVRRLAFFLVILVTIITIWQLPTLLRALPSRYVAAYLPEPIQALAEREHVETLPTSAASPDALTLLSDANLATLSTSTQDRVSEVKLATPTQPTAIEQRDEVGETRPEEASPASTPLAATSTPTVTPLPIPEISRLGPIRHHFQTWNNCGPATLAMALSRYEIYMDQEQTAAVLKPNEEDRNVSPYEMVEFVQSETELQALERANGNLDILRRLIADGFPVIVELGLDPPGEYRWMGWYGHYLLVVAYDNTSEQVWVYDSWFGTSEVPGENANPDGRVISYEELDRYWRQFNRNYIVLYPSESQDRVAELIGSDMSDESMWQRALETAQSELTAEEDNAYLWFNLGTNYNALGQYDKAAMSFDQARSIGLPWRMLWYQFGPYEAYYQTSRYEDIILLADVTLQNRPYFEESYYYRGLAYLALGDDNAAQDDFEKAFRFNPNFTAAAEVLEQLQS